MTTRTVEYPRTGGSGVVDRRGRVQGGSGWSSGMALPCPSNREGPPMDGRDRTWGMERLPSDRPYDPPRGQPGWGEGSHTYSHIQIHTHTHTHNHIQIHILEEGRVELHPSHEHHSYTCDRTYAPTLHEDDQRPIGRKKETGQFRHRRADTQTTRRQRKDHARPHQEGSYSYNTSPTVNSPPKQPLPDSCRPEQQGRTSYVGEQPPEFHAAREILSNRPSSRRMRIDPWWSECSPPDKSQAWLIRSAHFLPMSRRCYQLEEQDNTSYVAESIDERRPVEQRQTIAIIAFETLPPWLLDSVNTPCLPKVNSPVVGVGRRPWAAV